MNLRQRTLLPGPGLPGRLFERVRTSGNTSARLRLRGRDELAQMGASFDRLLETLEEFRRHDRVGTA
jgi:methyl-accepting chemotaxis protein